MFSKRDGRNMPDFFELRINSMCASQITAARISRERPIRMKVLPLCLD